MDNPNYYAIIPANVRYANINANAKLLYGEITALSNKNGYCHASNKYFAELYNVSTTSISLWIKELIDNNFIKSELIYKENSKEIANRYLKIINNPTQENLNTPIKKTYTPSLKKLKYPPQENLKDNNTSNNITSINNTSNNNNKDEAKPLSAYTICLEYWLKEFHVGWSFGAMQGKALKSIIGKLEKLLNDNEPNKVANSFKHLCQMLPEWYTTKDLNTIDSKFNEIVTEIKTKKHGVNKNQSIFRKPQ